MALGRHSDPEKHYYDLAVEEAAENAAQRSPEDADVVNELIEQAFERDIDDANKRRAFTLDVLKRADALRKKAASEKETGLLDTYKGKVVQIGAHGEEFEHAGVEKNFKKFTIGPWYKKVWQWLDEDEVTRENLNADILAVQEYEKQIAANKVRLEMYRATLESTKSARKLLKTVKAAVQSQPRTVLKKALNNYLKTRKDANQLEHDIASQEKEMVKKKERVDLALAKLDEKREKGRQLFNTMFKPRLDILIANKSKLSEAEYQAEMDDLRMDVRELGSKKNKKGEEEGLGIVYFEYFLNEALNEKPVTRLDTPDETPEYQAPQTEKEKAREVAFLSRWLKKVLGTAPSANNVQQLIEILREQQPKVLTQITQDPDSLENTSAVLEFLFNGKIKGKAVLPSSRRLKPTPQEVARILEGVERYEVLIPTEMYLYLNLFVDKWKDYDSHDFPNAFHIIQKGIGLPEEQGDIKAEDIKTAVDKNFPMGQYRISNDKIVSFILKNTHLQKMLLNDGTMKKVDFFISGKYTSPKGKPLDYSTPTDRLLSTLNEEGTLQFLRQYLKVIHDIDPLTFSREAEDFFNGPQADKGMPGFVQYLQKEYS